MRCCCAPRRSMLCCSEAICCDSCCCCEMTVSTASVTSTYAAAGSHEQSQGWFYFCAAAERLSALCAAAARPSAATAAAAASCFYDLHCLGGPLLRRGWLAGLAHEQTERFTGAPNLRLCLPSNHCKPHLVDGELADHLQVQAPHIVSQSRHLWLLVIWQAVRALRPACTLGPMLVACT